MKYIIITILALVATACTVDPLKDINDSNEWQKERNITSIQLEGQIGIPLIDRTFDQGKITIFSKLENILDMSAVEIINIELAYGASSQNTIGSTLDFSSGSALLTVESGAGETLDWEIVLQAFQSDLEGEWYIEQIGIYCDFFTWEDWGWEEYLNLTDFLTDAQAELDNKVNFIVDGADENGNPFGTFIHEAGNDNAFGSFSSTKDGWDFNDRYRKIPTGEGTWLRDFERNKVIITDSNNNEIELNLEIDESSGKITLKADLEYLSSEFNWDNTNWNYEKVAHMSNPMWYIFTTERVLQTGIDIKTFSVENQVGETEFNNDSKIISVTIPDDGTDISSIKISNLEVSYAAQADKVVGDILDFTNDNSAQINVTSEAGEKVTWTINLRIEADPNEVTIAGTWRISEIGLYSDSFSWESWGWDKTELLTNYLPSSSTELDNTITFTVDGTNENGQLYGSYNHDAGDDGVYGNFITDDTSWPETDFNARFRTVPIGIGTWIQDGETLIITDVNSDEFILSLEIKSGTEAALTSEVAYKSELYNWDNTNYSYEEVAHVSKKMWYNITK